MPSDRILVCGDTHAHYGWLKHLIIQAKKNDIDTILELGDFGFWPRRQWWGPRFLHKLTKACHQYDMNIYAIPGNHEDWETLLNLPVTDDGWWPIEDPHGASWGHRSTRIWMAPRGHRWEWDGVKFLAVGGGYSVDWLDRVPGISWFPEEQICDEDVQRAVQGGDTDILLVHDAPLGAQGVLGPDPWEGGKSIPEAMAHRGLIRDIFDQTHPKMVLHGHYHHRNSTKVEGVPVEGFANEWTGQDGWCILDLTKFKEKYLNV